MDFLSWFAPGMIFFVILTLHAIWPFLWIRAVSYHPEHGYGGYPGKDAADDEATRLKARVEDAGHHQVGR